MKLLVIELYSNLEQAIIPDTIQQVEAVRIHLYKHNTPAGSLQVLIKDGDTTIATSQIVNISDISEADFFHGQVTFEINVQLLKSKEYKILLQASGYTFTESAYVGWCRDFDFKTYPKGFEDRGSNLKSGFDYEIWTRK